jgi:DNA-directed RNA polymerase subunit beta
MTTKKIFISDLPDLMEIQKTSFCWFLDKGLAQELNKFSFIVDYTKNYQIRFYSNEFYFRRPRYNLFESKWNETTYSTSIFIPIEIENKKTKSIEFKNTFLCDLPLMTSRGTFLINGCERVILNQVVRSPGIYYKVETKKKKKEFLKIFTAILISYRGSWLYFEYDEDKLVWIKTDKVNKIPLPLLLESFNLQKDEIFSNVNYSAYFKYILQNKEVYNENIKDDDSSLNKTNTNSLLSWFKTKGILHGQLFDSRFYDIGEVGRYKINQRLNLNISEKIHTLTPQDIIQIVDYLIGLKLNQGKIDDIDHLQNRRVRSVGELLQNQFHLGLSRLERLISERMTMFNNTIFDLINSKPIEASINEFFGTNPLSQYLDQTNPLSELTHKRRISCLGPGGILRERVSLAVRDIDPSYYGRLCPIETPEGQNAGLISSLATYGRVNKYGFLESPFLKVEEGKIIRNKLPIYLDANQEKNMLIAAGDLSINREDIIYKEKIIVKDNQDFTVVSSKEIDYVGVSPIQIFSPATSLIPFLEHDDANRTLMGSNMQRQAVPLLRPQKPIVGTGIENQIALDSGMMVLSHNDGIVDFVSANKISIKDHFGKIVTYKLEKFQRSNQETCINQKPIVWVGEKVYSGQVIADGPSTDEGELALGQNITIAYMPWEGYNYEDAIVINERLVHENIFTSIHVEKYDIEVKETKAGPEKITREIPGVNEINCRHLDENGLVYKGAFVKSGDILVGKITPKNKSDQTPEIKLLKAIFGSLIPDIEDSSLRVPLGTNGRVLDIKIFSKENGDKLPTNVNYSIRIFLGDIRKIQVGDKMAGRHGNKGVISKIVARQDMPFLLDGTVVDIILNPLGVPSRMNVGQIFECLLGLAGHKLNKRFKIFPFDESYGIEASRILINQKLLEVSKTKKYNWIFNEYSPGKVLIRDGRSGEFFDNPVTVGKAYMLKLVHLVDDKIHARSIGPYSLITQQPLGGRARQGGQRFGEMEVWALEAYGAAYTLQELLTLKSDDIEGRNQTYSAIVEGKLIPRPNIPESFRVLLRELQALAIDISTYRFEKKSSKLELDLKEVKL